MHESVFSLKSIITILFAAVLLIILKFKCYINSIKSILRVKITLNSELSKPLFGPMQGIASSAVACLKANKIILNN